MMVIPASVRTTPTNNLEDFLKDVEQAFKQSLARIKAQASDSEFYPDMSTVEFTFVLANGNVAQAILQDKPFYD